MPVPPRMRGISCSVAPCRTPHLLSVHEDFSGRPPTESLLSLEAAAGAQRASSSPTVSPREAVRSRVDSPSRTRSCMAPRVALATDFGAKGGGDKKPAWLQSTSSFLPAAHATPHFRAFRGLALLGELGREGGPATRAPAVPGRGLSAGGSGVGASTPPLPPPPPATPAAAAAARRRLGVSSEGVTIRASYAAMRASLTAHARALARASLTRRAFFSSIYAALARPPLSSGWVAGGGVGLRDVGCGVWGVGVGK